MRLRLPRLPPLFYGWPRRAAAALCLALAVLTSLAPSRSGPAEPAPALPPGLVTTSAAVNADAVAFLHAGDRVDLVETFAAGDAQAAPIVVARGVRVIDIRAATEFGSAAHTAQLVVAAAPEDAVRIAAHQGDQVLAATTAPP